jgi:2-hydroxychromene-2-carboxylate isomerase
MTRRPRLYFSFRSPYSWLTIHRLCQAVPALFQATDLYPYWDPDKKTSAALKQRGGDYHYVQMSRAKHRYLLLDVKRLADREGLPFAWPIDIDCWWELPHLAWLHARREGRAWQFYEALIQARWCGGEDICQSDVIRAAAARAGLDPGPAVEAPHDQSIRREAVNCLYEAYLDDVFGIPYLKLGHQRFWGYDRLDAFLDVWLPLSATENCRRGSASASKTGEENQSNPSTERKHDRSGAPGPSFHPGLLEDSKHYDTDTAGGCG